MPEATNLQGEFIFKVLQTLERNGFPDKQVALPLEKLYASAHAKGINFNRILEFLQEKEGILHRKEGERIIFFSQALAQETSNPGGIPGFDFSALKNINFGDLMQQAQSMMQNMTPDQIGKMQEMMKNISPEQLNQFQQMFSNLSPEQVEDLKSKAEHFLKKDPS